MITHLAQARKCYQTPREPKCKRFHFTHYQAFSNAYKKRLWNHEYEVWGDLWNFLAYHSSEKFPLKFCCVQMKKTTLILICADGSVELQSSLHPPCQTNYITGILISTHSSLWCSTPVAFHPWSFPRQGFLDTFPCCSIWKLLLLKLSFILMKHQGTENYFPLKETAFGLQTAGGILSLTEHSAPSPDK